MTSLERERINTGTDKAKGCASLQTDYYAAAVLINLLLKSKINLREKGQTGVEESDEKKKIKSKLIEKWRNIPNKKNN